MSNKPEQKNPENSKTNQRSKNDSCKNNADMKASDKTNSKNSK